MFLVRGRIIRRELRHLRSARPVTAHPSPRPERPGGSLRPGANRTADCYGSPIHSALPRVDTGELSRAPRPQLAQGTHAAPAHSLAGHRAQLAFRHIPQAAVSSAHSGTRSDAPVRAPARARMPRRTLPSCACSDCPAPASLSRSLRSAPPASPPPRGPGPSSCAATRRVGSDRTLDGQIQGNRTRLHGNRSEGRVGPRAIRSSRLILRTASDPPSAVGRALGRLRWSRCRPSL